MVSGLRHHHREPINLVVLRVELNKIHGEPSLDPLMIGTYFPGVNNLRAHLHLATATRLWCHCDIAPNRSQSKAFPQRHRSDVAVTRCDSRVFSQLSDLTFLSFFYKIDITGFKKSGKKIASTGYWTHNTNPTIKIPAPLPTQPICQSMPVSNFQTFLKSCSIKPEMIQVQFKDILFNRCLGGRVVKGAGIVRVGLVLWVQYPVEAIFFFADF